MNLTVVILLLISWYLKAFTDAIIFAKGGTNAYEVWHILDALSRWLFPCYILIRFEWYKDGWLILLAVGLFCFNILYLLFRSWRVVRLDDHYRIKWLGKILERGGII